MVIKIIFGAFITLAGIASLLLGILFVIAALGVMSRYVTGGVLVSLGIALIIPGVAIFRRGMAVTPKSIRGKILRLARRNGGRLSEEAIFAETGHGTETDLEVRNFISWGLAEKTTEGGQPFLVFRDLQMKLVLKKCPHCGNDYPVRGDVEQCPSCGSDLKMVKTSVPDDGKFFMDE